MSLPLPETTYALASPGGRWHEEYVLNESGYSTDQMQVYGQACREAALEEAALACESAIASIWDYHDDGRKQIGATVCNNLAAAIRALREST